MKAKKLVKAVHSVTRNSEYAKQLATKGSPQRITRAKLLRTASKQYLRSKVKQAAGK